MLDGVDTHTDCEFHADTEASSNIVHGLCFLFLDHFVFFNLEQGMKMLP